MALASAATVISWATLDKSVELEDLRKRMELTQEQFRQIALAYDAAIIVALQNYPPPDFDIRSQGESEMDKEYERLSRMLGANRFHPARAERINNERRSSHFDALALLPEKPFGHWHEEILPENVPLGALREFHQHRAFCDPFVPNYQLGYISTYADYWLISVGPDRKPDILGFLQSAGGSYKARGELTDLTSIELAELATQARAKFHGTPYKSFDLLDIISPDLIYDPTNGAFSGGDIVFKRRGGDDWLFSYPGSYTLTPKNLIPKDIEKVFP